MSPASELTGFALLIYCRCCRAAGTRGRSCRAFAVLCGVADVGPRAEVAVDVAVLHQAQFVGVLVETLRLGGDFLRLLGFAFLFVVFLLLGGLLESARKNLLCVFNQKYLVC